MAIDSRCEVHLEKAEWWLYKCLKCRVSHLAWNYGCPRCHEIITGHRPAVHREGRACN